MIHIHLKHQFLFFFYLKCCRFQAHTEDTFDVEDIQYNPITKRYPASTEWYMDETFAVVIVKEDEKIPSVRFFEFPCDNVTFDESEYVLKVSDDEYPQFNVRVALSHLSRLSPPPPPPPPSSVGAYYLHP